MPPLTTSYNPYAPTLPTRPVVPNVAPTQRAVGGGLMAPTSAPAATPGRSALGQTMDFLGSPGGQFIAGVGYTGLQSYLNRRDAEQAREADSAERALDREQRADEARQNALRGAAEALMTNRRQSATGALRDLGEGAAFATRQARTSAIADLLGQRLMPGNPRIAAAMGPGNRVSPEVLARLRQASSPNATAAALAQRDMDIANINPASRGTDISTLTGLRPADPFLAELINQRTSAQQQSQQSFDESESYARQLLAQAIDMPSLAQPGGAAPRGSFQPLDDDPDLPYRTPRNRPTGANY
jgi:hypothetical protein